MTPLPITLVHAAGAVVALLGSIWWFQRESSPRIRALALGCALATIALLPQLFTSIFGHNTLGRLLGDEIVHGGPHVAHYVNSAAGRLLKIAVILHNLGWFVAGLSLFRHARDITPSPHQR